MIRCCLTCAQYGTCVGGPSQVLDALPPGAAPEASASLSLLFICEVDRRRERFPRSGSRVRAPCNCRPALTSALAHQSRLPLLCFWFSCTRQGPGPRSRSVGRSRNRRLRSDGQLGAARRNKSAGGGRGNTNTETGSAGAIRAADP